MNTRLRKAEIFHEDLGMLTVLYRVSSAGAIGDIQVDKEFHDNDFLRMLSDNTILQTEIQALVCKHHLKTLEYEREQQKEAGSEPGYDGLSGAY